MQYVIFCNWFSSHSIMFSNFTGHSMYQHSIFIAKCFTVWIYNILFIHPSADGYFPCFPLLTVMNNAVVEQHYSSTFIYKPLGGYTFLFLLGLYQGLKFLGHIVTICLTFWGTDRLFSKVTERFYIPLSKVWEWQPLHAVTTLVSVWIFHHSHPSRYRMVSHCGFELHFHND